MSENELNDTQPSTISTEAAPTAKKRFPGWLAVLVMVILIAIGILGGYGSGMNQRYSAQGTQVNGQLQAQYQLGVQAVNAGQYAVAKQHFEYIIQNYPDYPGVRALIRTCCCA
jgi:TolA-binding protein